MLSWSLCPVKKGKPGKSVKNTIRRFCPSPPHPLAEQIFLSRLKKFSSSASSSSSLYSNGNYLHFFMTTVCPARLLLLDANMLHANISVGQRVVAQIMREQDSRKRLQSHREESVRRQTRMPPSLPAWLT